MSFSRISSRFSRKLLNHRNNNGSLLLRSQPQPQFNFPILSAQLHSIRNVREKVSLLPDSFFSVLCRRFSSHGSPLPDASQGPASIDYRSLLQEDEYHRLANATIHELLEKLEEYGDSVDIDGFDVDYGNEVLTLKLGSMGTYVINKQTPNRQIWMSSPVSGPSRFDWDHNSQRWVYRRTKANLETILEEELEKLCGNAINLS